MDFEYLVRDILNARLGLDLHAYPSGVDRGIDLLQVRPDGHRIVVQCKHYLKSDRSKLISAAKNETAKDGFIKANRYIFVTSHPVNAATEAEIMNIFGIPQKDVWGPDELNAALDIESDVERRHFKLWLSSAAVLETIVGNQWWNQSFELLEDIARRARFWVDTPDFHQVAKALDDAGVCVLTGAPGVGKSYLAEVLALQRAYEGWNVIGGSSDPNQCWQLLRRQDATRQFFLLSDPLGEAALSPFANENAASIQRLVSAIAQRRDTNKRLIVISSSEVLSRAESFGDRSLQRLAKDRKYRYEISVENWPDLVRKQILLTHLLFSGLSVEDRAVLDRDRRIISIIRHQSFNPRVIEAVCEQFADDVTVDEALEQLTAALDDPEYIWASSWAMLDGLSAEIVLTLATLAPRYVSMNELRRLVAPATPAKDWVATWQSLTPMWISVSGKPAGLTVALANPGLRGFIQGRLDDSAMAGERIDNAQTLEQLVELAYASGDLSAGPDLRTRIRPVLGDVLRKHRIEIVDRVKRYAEMELSVSNTSEYLLKLNDAAALLGMYGRRTDSEWVCDKVGELLSGNETVPVARGLAFAAGMKRHLNWADVSDTASDLCARALASIETLGDLDTVEDHALLLGIDLSSVRPDAERVIFAELSHLADELDPEIIRSEAHGLQSHAMIYGFEPDIQDLLELADYLEFS
ncbi:restriction endonuclease [Nocardia sp. NPDC057030]|uniref:nSTAND3 domain-containing NTPase n=1 Tax=unclassified Nocardia TaxID=2637762 RepID=UPI003626EE20